MNEIITLLERHGPSIVFLVAFLEQIGAPVPAIPVIIVAGAVAATAGTSVGQLLALAVGGALLADTIWYFLGVRYGYRVLGVLCRISLSPDSCVRKTEEFFQRWGLLSLMLAKFVPGFSIVAPPLAGALRRSRYSRFLLYDGVGAVLWGGAALLIGVLFHDAIDRLLEALGRLGGWSLVVLLSLLVLFILFRWYERRRFYKSLRMARITPEELNERMRSGSALVILDARAPSLQMREPHRIPGAILLDPAAMEERLMDIDPSHEIVLYCT